MYCFSKIRLFLWLTCCISGIQLNAQLRLPQLISGGMVLQRNKPLRLWGWGVPGHQVNVEFLAEKYQSTCAQDSSWSIPIPPHPSDTPFSMTFRMAAEVIKIEDVQFGEVWLASGQSNMELPMDRVNDTYTDEFTRATYPDIRQFYVPRVYDFNEPKKQTPGAIWQKVSKESIGKFSAAGYFFATALYDSLHVPIGIINAALGGSPAQAWIDPIGIKHFPAYAQEARQFASAALRDSIQQRNLQTQLTWFKLLEQADIGKKEGWCTIEQSFETDSTIQIPGALSGAIPDFQNGSIWVKKSVSIPEKLAGSECRLFLGRIVDADSVFLNGVFVGTTSYQYPPRKYKIPKGLLREGVNEFCVRILVQGGAGELVADKPYSLLFPSGESMSLEGSWYYRVGCHLPAQIPTEFIQWKATGLYNGMIAPLAPYGIRGVIWYQGESNTAFPEEYSSLMSQLIYSWRTTWRENTLPFLMVQLPNFGSPLDKPAESNWAALRQQQLQTLWLPHTGLAVAIDLGEWNDIHPLNKKEVGMRLALQAYKKVYGLKVEADGPMVSNVHVSGSLVELEWENLAGGLITGTEIRHFELAGRKRTFYSAKAWREGTTVQVQSPSVPRPRYIRYAWSDNPEGVNLYNKAGLPALPFERKLR